MNIIANFSTYQTFGMTFDVQQEKQVPFLAGLLLGSPLLLALFGLYATAVSTFRPQSKLCMATSYVDDEIMIQRAKSQKGVSKTLHHRLD